jgi:hypothetical protein
MVPHSTPEQVPPPPSVWDEIAARTGVTARPRPEIVASPLLPAPEPRPAAEVAPRRPRRPRWLFAAAAALVEWSSRTPGAPRRSG